MSAKPKGASQVIGNLSSASTTLSTHIENDQNNVDVRLRLLYKNNLIPKEPYILTVPCENPYIRHPSQCHAWNINSLFSIHEEQLQYMTFLYRENTDGVLRPIAGDTEDVMDKGKQPTNNTPSGTPTPSNGKKIKMTLSDYVTSKPKAGMVAKVGQEVEASGSVDGVAKGPLKVASSHSSPKRVEKRSADAVPLVNNNPKAEIPSPTKKLRQSSPSRPSHEPPPTVKAEPLKLPPARVNLLPPLLSPTLPASIEAELARLEELELSAASKNLTHQKSNSTASSSSDNKNLSSSHTSSPNSSKSLPTERLNRSSSTVPGKGPKKEPPRAEPIAGERRTTSEVKTAPSKRDIGAKATQKEARVTKSTFFDYHRGQSSPALVPAVGARPGTVETRKMLLVKLKYGKGNKTRVQRLLNLNTKSQSKKASEAKPIAKDRPKEESRHDRDRQQDRESRGDKAQGGQDDQKSGGDSRGVNSRDTGRVKQKELPKPAEKRPRPVDEERPREPPAKRQKAPEAPSKVKIRTPTAPAFRSPSIANTGSVQRDQDATPKKQSQATPSAPMHRVSSSETHVETPRAPPGSAEKANGNGREASVSATSDGRRTNDSSSNKDIDGWRGEIGRYNLLGKDLKRQADSLFRDDPDPKRALVVAFESMFCYMISFAAEGNRNGNGDPVSSWKSLPAYCAFVAIRARPFPLIHGLSMQLSAVCHEMALAFDLDNHAKSTPPDPANREEYAKYMKVKTELSNSSRTTKEIWSKGLSALSVSDLQENFPETWAKQAKRFPGEMRETPGKYGGPYRLPLTSCSTALEAVRVGHSILKEWCRKENVDIASKVVLE